VAQPAETAASARRRILDGFARAIRENGLQQAGISDVVRNARASKSTFYECFASKEECLAALAEDRTASLRCSVEDAIDREAPWEAQIDSVVDAYVDAVERDPLVMIAIMRELPLLSSVRFALLEKDVDFYSALFMELSRGPMMRRAGVRPLSEEMAVFLVGGISELVDRRLREGEPLAPAGAMVKQMLRLMIAPR
jgi:AcrR family transcriptional regulator